MAEAEQFDSTELPDLPDEPWDWEEISLNILFSTGNHSAARSSEKKRHRLRWMTKPRAVPQLILKLQDRRSRESALRMLSLYLYEKREDDPENYYDTALLLYDSFGTMAILTQELIAAYGMMSSGSLTERAAMRLINVIILFQCIAANSKTRQKFVNCYMANLLEPLATYQSSLEVYDNVRAVVLSVFGIICQGREPDNIQWAIKSPILEICWFNLETGNELSKVIGLHILESILQDKFGLSWFLGSSCSSLLNKFFKTWENLVKMLAVYRCRRPRLLFHIIRCYTLLCRDSRGHDIVKATLPQPLVDGTFCEILEEGKEMVEALSLREPLAITLTDEKFTRFQNLRFLELAGQNLEGNSDNMLSELVCLSWHFCPSEFKISKLYFGNLVILDLSSRFIDENWGGSGHIQMANNLKVLCLRNCHDLTRTPDFIGLHNLERLILSHCSRLARIGSSIENLRSLKFLDLRCCNSLRGLPEELGSLEDVEEIFVSGNHGTFNLPKSLGNLKSLVSLTLESLTINSIPDSLGRLVKLKHISITLCHGMKKLPESLGDLESLLELDLSYDCDISELTHSIGELVKLKQLNLVGCLQVKEFPDSLSCLLSLIRLDLSWTGLSNFPASIGDIQELQVLNLSGCKIRRLPESNRRLKKLVELHLHYCEFLEKVPQEIGGLSSLRKLVLSCSGIRSLPPTITQLSLLEELQIQRCVLLQVPLPELPAGLANSNVSYCSRKEHDLSELDVISTLDNNDPEATQKLSKLKNLEVFLSSASLPSDLSSLSALESLRLVVHPLHCMSASLVLPAFSSMKDLARLDFQHVLMEDGFEIRGVKELENLETVSIHHSSSKFMDI